MATRSRATSTASAGCRSRMRGVGVDIGGSRAASAVVYVTEDLRVASRVFHGDEAILGVVAYVRELADTYEIVELIHDPWRFQQAALELAEHGLLVVQFPQ